MHSNQSDGDRAKFTVGWWANFSQVIATFVAVLALIASFVFSWDANRNSEAALSLAQSTAERELARNVFLGELPRDYEPSPAESRQAGINSNIVAVYDVWVEGVLEGEPASVNIWTVQSCTGYTLPSGFSAKRMHFFDGTLGWTRETDGRLNTEEHQPVPEVDTGDSPGTFAVDGCA